MLTSINIPVGTVPQVIPYLRSANECVCAGDKLIYTCTVQVNNSNGNTIWNGTAFTDCLQNEITLLHSRFSSTGDFGWCNKGAIMARSLGAEENNNYTSQLNITLTPYIAGKTIMCAYDTLTTDNAYDRILFSAIVPGKKLMLVLSILLNFISIYSTNNTYVYRSVSTS